MSRLSRKERLRRILRNTQNTKSAWDKLDEEFGYMIWLAQKEFNVGLVTGDFPVMKLFHLHTDKYSERYNKSMEGNSKSSSTFTGEVF